MPCAPLLALLLAQDVEHAREPLEQVRAALGKKEALLVDVREAAEWRAGHLEAAVFLPLSRLKEASAEEVEKILSRKKIVYTHCRSGVRSVAAARILKPLGYDVRPLKQGFAELRTAGFREAKD